MGFQSFLGLGVDFVCGCKAVCIRSSDDDTKGRGRLWQGSWILPVFTLAYC